MTTKKIKNMSLAVDPDFKEKLDYYAKLRGVTVSKLVRDVVEKYLVSEEDVIPVILRVPKKLEKNKQGLEEWMAQKSAAIVNALG